MLAALVMSANAVSIPMSRGLMMLTILSADDVTEAPLNAIPSPTPFAPDTWGYLGLVLSGAPLHAASCRSPHHAMVYPG